MKVNYLRALTSQPRVCFLWRPPTVLTSLIIYYCRESKAQLSISQRLSCAAFVLFCGPWVKNWIGTRPSTGTNPTETLFCNLKDGEVIKFLLQKLTLTPNPNRRFGWELWRLHTFLYLLEPRTWTCSQWTPRSTSHRRTEKKKLKLKWRHSGMSLLQGFDVTSWTACHVTCPQNIHTHNLRTGFSRTF